MISSQLSMVKHLNGENEGKNIIIRGLNRKSIISACLLNGANLQGKPMTPKEVAEIFEITVNPSPQVDFSEDNQFITSGDTTVPVTLSSSTDGVTLGVPWDLAILTHNLTDLARI